jgi:hypothetical protein
MKIVVIEWDGKQPPTTYYNGMRRLHLKVRGNKDQDPIVRRSREEDHSVIAQEGAVLVESESLARQVAYLAKECGARSVFVGVVDLSVDAPNRVMTQAEIDVVNRFNKAFRQRGRPAEGEREDRSWVVSCPECSQTSISVSDKMVIQCPKCGGLRVASRVGNRHVFSHHPTTLDEWKDMHFVEGYFEIPEVHKDEVGEPIKDIQLDGDNLYVFNGLKSSSMVNNYLVPKMDNIDFRQLINDLFVAHRYFSQKDRQHARTKMVVDLLQKGIDSSKVPLMSKNNEYEVLDASVIEGDIFLIRQFYQSI